MSGLRNNKNIQTAIASGVYVGLHAEHCHVSELHATKFHSDECVDIFATIKTLQEQYSNLLTTVKNLKLSDLDDVSVTNASNGDTLVLNNGVWQAAEMNTEETTVST